MTELNGSPADPEALRTLALTNYGHFTTMVVEDGRVRGAELHLDRLARDCRVLFDAPLDLGRVRAWARRVVPVTGRCTVRITVFDPALHLGDIARDADPQVLVTARPAPAVGAEPLRVRSAVHLRDLPEVKGVGLFGVLRLRREARRAGFDDVLFTDGDSTVLEGSTWNVGVVREGRVVWPAGHSGSGGFHQDSVTRHYARAVHAQMADGKACAFASGDVGHHGSLVHDGAPSEAFLPLGPFS